MAFTFACPVGVRAELDTLKQMGARSQFLVGRTRKLTDLLAKDGFDAVFIGSGPGLPKFMNIEVKTS